MNRQEAAIIIKAIGKHAIETHLTDPGDIVDATVMAVQALVPKPDEVTGLVPCGCGGKAKLVVQIESNYSVRCEKCGFRSGVLVGWEPAKTDTIKAWNTAMGYREEEGHD